MNSNETALNERLINAGSGVGGGKNCVKSPREEAAQTPPFFSRESVL